MLAPHIHPNRQLAHHLQLGGAAKPTGFSRRSITRPIHFTFLAVGICGWFPALGSLHVAGRNFFKSLARALMKKFVTFSTGMSASIASCSFSSSVG
jgi:hypothetical protein